jgi:hypothetical protein
MNDAEPFLKITDTLFHQEFGDDLEAIPWRCFIVTNPKDLGVGTISAWYDRDFRGQRYCGVHEIPAITGLAHPEKFALNDGGARSVVPSPARSGAGVMTDGHDGAWPSTQTIPAGTLRTVGYGRIHWVALRPS